MEKQKIVSLGVACSVNYFFWWLGISKPSPLDNSGFIPYRSLKCLLDGSFFKAIEENNFTFSPIPLDEKQDHAKNYAILKVGEDRIHYPHAELSDRFIEHVKERAVELKKSLENENTIFAIPNREEKPFSVSDAKELISLGRFTPENLIILNRVPDGNPFSQFGFTSVDTFISHDDFYNVKRDTKTLDEFIRAWKEYCEKYPKMAEKIEEIKVHEYFD